MTDIERNAARGQLVEDHRQAKEELVLLENQAAREIQELKRLAAMLEKGPPYSILPTVAVDGARIQQLFKDWHEAYERRMTLGKRMRDMGVEA